MGGELSCFVISDAIQPSDSKVPGMTFPCLVVLLCRHSLSTPRIGQKELGDPVELIRMVKTSTDLIYRKSFYCGDCAICLHVGGRNPAPVR